MHEHFLEIQIGFICRVEISLKRQKGVFYQAKKKGVFAKWVNVHCNTIDI